MSQNFKKTEYFLVIIAAFVGICYVLSHYGGVIAAVFLPFALAAIIAHFLSPPAQFLMKRFRFPKWAAHIFVVISFYGAIFTAAYILLSRLFNELSGFSEYILLLGDSIPELIGKASAFLKEKLGFSSLSSENTQLFAKSFGNFLSVFSQKLAGFASSFLTKVISFVPRFILSSAVTILATCYFSADLKRIKRFILFQLPDKAKVFLSAFRIQFFSTVSKYVSAYLTLGIITFFELFAGLMFVNREYAFILALGITLLDALPFIGCGVVLLPWSAVSFMTGNIKNAVLLAVLFVIVTAVHQTAEPKILGSFTGLHPLLTLFSIYAGARLLGFAGVFIFPIAAVVIKNLNDTRVIKLFSLPPEDENEKISGARSKYKRYKKGM